MSIPALTQPERVAVARLQAMLELLPTALDRELAPAGLTAFEFTLLEALAEADQHRLRLSALAARTNATLPRLSRVVTALERKQLVERVACPSDGRATNAVLTPNGLAAYTESRGLHAEAVRTFVLDGLDHDDVDQLARLTYAVLTRLDPQARYGITTDGIACAADPSAADGPASDDPTCSADPPACPADPALLPSTAIGAAAPS
ncbi:MAG: winged helix-turn-helix transcriptional regulator [Propionibacteriaceae bacterium]|nr:winged helix-turn-helix transcriptional regulator [Propionibacteriaceae bacterium]